MIFFFFFFLDYIDPIIKKAFDMVCGKKLRHDGYWDMSKYVPGPARFTKDEIRQSLSSIDSPFFELYDKALPADEKAACTVWEDFANRIKSEDTVFNSTNYEDITLSYAESKAIIRWVYHAYKTAENCKEQTKKVLCSIDERYESDLDFMDRIVFLRSRVDIHFVHDVEGYIRDIPSIREEDATIFYRGHSDVNYILQPSIMRSDKWICHEHDMNNEIMIECPDDFKDCASHLDYLVLMQHYGLPTRLLDVTKNPLVALYFACIGEENQNGEIIVLRAPKNKIKYPRSDTVSVLSSLSLLDLSTKKSLRNWANSKSNFEDAKKAQDKLLHEIQNEKPAFENKISEGVIRDCFFVLATKKNSRIANQDGAFIICGLLDDTGEAINKYRYSEDGKIQIYVVEQREKKKILDILNKLSINKARLFPEIEDVSLYIKSKY